MGSGGNVDVMRLRRLLVAVGVYAGDERVFAGMGPSIARTNHMSFFP